MSTVCLYSIDLMKGVCCMSTIYLVTGGCGFLGSEVVRLLLEQDAQVRVLALQSDPQCAAVPKQAALYYGDLTTGEGLDAFFDVPAGAESVVIHTAGIVSLAPGRDQLVYDVNVGGTKRVLDYCLRRKVRRLVHVSSVHAIPVLPKGQVMAEPERFDPDLVVGWYAKTKTMATQAVLDAVKNDGLNASIVFPSGIWGPGDWKQGNLTQVFKDYWNGKLPAGVEGGYNFVDVRDAAAGIVSCAQMDRLGENYILAGHYVTIRQMLDAFQKITGKRPVKHILPMWLAKAALPLLQLGSKLSDKPPVYSSYALYTLGANAAFSIEKPKRELGFTLRPFEDSLRDTFHWLTENNLL